MLKSSSLCLYSSNLGTFWLKIEQFWPFEEIYIFSNGGHLGYRTALTDTILKGTIPAWFGLGRDGPWVGPFQNYVRQPRPPFKMAAVTKNRNFFNYPLLL
jgi:hypothetical protein